MSADINNIVNWLKQWFTTTDDLSAVALSNDYTDLDNTPNIPSGAIVDTILDSSSNHAIANSTVTNTFNNLLDTFYPVGAIYISTNSTSPEILFGGTWERITGKFLLAASSSYPAGHTGGSADAVIVSHSHTVSGGSHGHTGSYDIWNAGSSVSTAGHTVNWTSHGPTKINNVSQEGGHTHNCSTTGESKSGKNMPPYLSVYIWERVPDITFDGITLTSDKSILSANDNEYATLTAQLTSAGSAIGISGETVTFEVRKDSDDSLVETLTGTTNSSGIATVYYYGQGAGNLYIKAICSTLLSEIYVLEDCDYWNENGIIFTSNSNTDRRAYTGLESIINYTPPNKFELSYTLESSTFGKRLYLTSISQSTSSSNYYAFGCDIDTRYCNCVLRITASTGTQTTRTNPANFRIVRDGTTVKWYCNDVLIRTETVNWIDTYAPYTLSWGIWNTGTVIATNIKIKAL